MPTQNGIPVNFSFTTTGGDKGLTATGLTGFLLQSVDYEDGADKEEVRSLGGDIVSRNWYDLHVKTSLKFFIAAASKSAAVAASTLQTAGTFINITACASHPALVASNWEVQNGTKITGDVTKSAEITIPLESRAGITAAQS
jgi:hypothetical protein